MIIGDSEVEYDPNFRLYLQTKLSNPHYKPEIAAQTTLLNFCVTEKGLEDQLLALVVDHERPDLQEQAQQLVCLSLRIRKCLIEPNSCRSVNWPSTQSL